MSLHASTARLGQLERLDEPAGAAAKVVQQVIGQGRIKDLLAAPGSAIRCIRS